MQNFRQSIQPLLLGRLPARVHDITGRLLFQIRVAPGWIKVSALAIFVLLPALAFGGMFWAPDQVAFSFNSQTCVNKPSLFPSVNSRKPGSVFDLEQVAEFSFGTTPVYSKKTCIHLTKQPQETLTELLEIQTPLGLTTTIRVSTPVLPEIVDTDAIDPNISGKEGMRFKLSVADTTFSYVLEINEQSIACTVSNTEIWCPFSETKFVQGSVYPYSLKRLFEETVPTTLYSATVQTSEPITIAPISPQQDETILTPLQTITLNSNKAIKTLGEISLHSSTGTPVSFQAASSGTTITITADDQLPRESTFVLTIAATQAVDSGYLSEPFTLTFSTSGGPKVISTSIPKLSAPASSQFSITTDIDLHPEQNNASLISVTSDGIAVPVNVQFIRNTITVTPTTPLPSCSSFTVTLSTGSVSIHGIGNGQKWSYSSKTTCGSTFFIGKSVEGRGILAYKFGSGSKTIVFVGGTHGTEGSSVRTLDAWVSELEAGFSRIPKDTTVVVIPNSNPDGYATGTRTNTNGVDLNRNYPTDSWASGVYQPGNVFLPNGGGSSPLSEPETIALSNYIQSSSPSLVLTYHAVARVVISNGTNSDSIAAQYGSLSGFPSYSSGSGGSVFSYATTGEFETWTSEKMGIPTLLIELATTNKNEISTQRTAMWAMVEQ